MSQSTQSLQLDHIVYACKDLAQGAAFIERTLGVPAQAGGQHLRLGTHNMLLSLGPEQYLELIAIDPTNDQPPFQPRWFGLDDESLQAQIAHEPKLVHWVARSPVMGDAANDDIARRSQPLRDVLGPVHPMQRAAFQWRITIPTQGTPSFGGVVPTLIQWDIPTPPFRNLTDRGVRLKQLAASVALDELEAVQQALAALGVADLIRVEGSNTETRLEAHFVKM
jgi:hypothetical protein